MRNAFTDNIGNVVNTLWNDVNHELEELLDRINDEYVLIDNDDNNIFVLGMNGVIHLYKSGNSWYCKQ